MGALIFKKSQSMETKIHIIPDNHFIFFASNPYIERYAKRGSEFLKYNKLDDLERFQVTSLPNIILIPQLFFEYYINQYSIIFTI